MAVRALLLLFTLVVVGLPVQGNEIIFADSFSGYGAPSGGGLLVSAFNSFGLWQVTAGSIDILNNYPGLSCNSGPGCLDMAGLSGGTIVRNVNFQAGLLYTLTFWYSGSQRSAEPDTMTVSLGTANLVLSDVPSNQPWTMATLQFVPTIDMLGEVKFAHAGIDTVGILLDDVTLTGVPEPASWLLAGAALLLTGLLRRRARC